MNVKPNIWTKLHHSFEYQRKMHIFGLTFILNPNKSDMFLLSMIFFRVNREWTPWGHLTTSLPWCIMEVQLLESDEEWPFKPKILQNNISLDNATDSVKLISNNWKWCTDVIVSRPTLRRQLAVALISTHFVQLGCNKVTAPEVVHSCPLIARNRARCAECDTSV